MNVGERCQGRANISQCEANSTIQNTRRASNAGVVTYKSSSESADLEQGRSSINPSDNAIYDRIDIQYAEEQFAELKEHYAGLSRIANSASPPRKRPDFIEDEMVSTRLSDRPSSEDEFDLEDILRDRNKREREHDIKPKHLGISTPKSLLTCRRNL